jgi:hypothetical protein
MKSNASGQHIYLSLFNNSLDTSASGCSLSVFHEEPQNTKDKGHGSVLVLRNHAVLRRKLESCPENRFSDLFFVLRSRLVHTVSRSARHVPDTLILSPQTGGS